MTNPNALAPLPPAATTLADARQVDMGLGPRNLAQAWALAEALARSTLVPEAYQGKPANVIAMMHMANDLRIGITQAMREIHPSGNGRVGTSAALCVSLVLQSGVCELWEIVEHTPTRAVVRTKRRGRQPETMEYTIDEAKAAGLYPGKEDSAWRKYPRLMLRHRAEKWLADMVYPDVVRGLKTADELAEVVDAPETLQPRAVVASAQAVVAPVVEAAPASQLPPLPSANEQAAEAGPPPPADVEAKDPVDQLLADLAAVDLAAPDAKAKVDACSARVKDVTPTGHPRRQEVSRAFSAVRTQLQQAKR